MMRGARKCYVPSGAKSTVLSESVSNIILVSKFFLVEVSDPSFTVFFLLIPTWRGRTAAGCRNPRLDEPAALRPGLDGPLVSLLIFRASGALEGSWSAERSDLDLSLLASPNRRKGRQIGLRPDVARYWTSRKGKRAVGRLRGDRG